MYNTNAQDATKYMYNEFACIDKADKTHFCSNTAIFLVCYVFGRYIFIKNDYIFGQKW